VQIEIIGTESLGVRGLCVVVTVKDRKIIIDPGVALGYSRHGKLPHPFQVAVGAKIREKIIESLKSATDVVISHYHGDHIPLVNPNPYQLNARMVIEACRNTRFWCKDPGDASDKISIRYYDLSRLLNMKLPIVEGQTNGLMTFSSPQPHGEKDSVLGMVMMTRIQDGKEVFVHASDIQLLYDDSISHILNWEPDIVLVSGPPLYLSYLTPEQKERAHYNAVRLAGSVATLIIDHHLLRSEEGSRWLDNLASSTGDKIICAADFMGCRRLLLESWRDYLYDKMPVPEGWHEAYANGDVDTDDYGEILVRFLYPA
jgi:hypothetical protein